MFKCVNMTKIIHELRKLQAGAECHFDRRSASGY